MYVCRWTGPCQSLRAQLLTSYGGKAKHIHIIWNMKTLSDTPQTVNDAHLYTLRHARIHTRTHTHIPHTVDVRNVLAHTHTHTSTDRQTQPLLYCLSTSLTGINQYIRTPTQTQQKTQISYIHRYASHNIYQNYTTTTTCCSQWQPAHVPSEVF